MNRIAKSILTLVRYGERSGGDYHAISNQVWLWNIALTLAMMPLIGVLFVLYGHLMPGQRWNYLISYISVPVGFVTLQISLFWWGNAQSLSRRTLALHGLIFSDCAMIWLFCMLVGAAGGIHFIFPAALALPFYFFRREIQVRAWLIKGIWVAAIAGQFIFALLYLSDAAAWRSLPNQVTQIARYTIFALAGVIAVIWVVYFWWQLKVTARILKVWDQVSQFGLTPEFTGLERKKEILFNRALAINVLYNMIIATGVILAFGLIAVLKNEGHLLYFGYFYLPTFWSIGAIIMFILWQRKRNHSLFINPKRSSGLEYFAYSISLLLIYCMGIMLPMRTMFFLYALALIALLPIIPNRRRLDIFLKPFFGLVTIGVFGLIGLWHDHNLPVTNLPEWVIWPTAVIMSIGAGLLIYLVGTYIATESDKSESALEVAHAESEKLLLNILPAQVSHELKSRGHTIPREYSSATVLFTDFVGFTRIAERLTAVELVRELDQCFSYFDNVAHKYGLEKLKTIGDAYMAAGGIPIENRTHPIDCALAALEIQSFMNQMKDIKEHQGLPYWELRLGMHTGPLVAGVVGEKKFAYDVWGDTVNTASRMESSGEPGAINISRELYEQLRFLFLCKYRGKVYAKNKGEIEMYFLHGLKPKFSIEGGGRVPNAKFKDIYEKIKRGARLIEKRTIQDREAV